MILSSGHVAHPILREITYVPGFFKIVDEILVNAADNKASHSFGFTFMALSMTLPED
jgi:hypothetical protein